MLGINNQRVAEECGVNPEELKEVFRAIVLDIESEAHAGNEEFAVEASDFESALEATSNIPIAASAAEAAEYTIRAQEHLTTVMGEMHNEMYASVLQTDVLSSLKTLESCFIEYTNHYGQDSIEAQ